jgi:pyruvate formate lyase activating enzyme
MRLGGLLKFSLIDYPGKVAAVVFTQGCNYRCPFCHNPELVLPDLFSEPLLVEEVLSFLEKRRGQLQGLAITGGEPTLHHDLPDFIRAVKAKGFLVKLDTNGSNPEMLRLLIEEKLVDHIAMDIKSSLASYDHATGIKADTEALKASIELIKASGIDHEFRTTALKSIVSDADMVAISSLIGPGEVYNLRRGNLKGKILDYAAFADKADYTDEEWARMKKIYSDAPITGTDIDM